MFKLVLSDKDIQKVRTFCAHGFFGARINTAIAAYGTDERFVRTWYEESDGKVLGVMQLTEDNAVVQCAQNVDMESLCSLLRFVGAHHVTGEAQTMRMMPFTVANGGVLMQANSVANCNTKAVLLDAEQLRSLFSVLFSDRDVQNARRAFASWYADLSHRVRHGLCDCFAVFEDDEAVSCASVLYSNAQYGCIGAVATRIDRRHNGLACECTLAAAQSVLQSGLIPCLACENGIAKMYEQIGFSVCGEWTELTV